MFSPQEWGDSALLGRMPAWERAGYVNSLCAFPATFIAFVLRPRRFLRRLRCEEGLLGVVLFAALLVPASISLGVGLSYAADLAGRWWAGPLGIHYPSWQIHVWPDTWGDFLHHHVQRVIHIVALHAAIGLAWLPTLAALDLLLWRQRREFRLIAKALLYTFVWVALTAAPCAAVINAVLGQFDLEWQWSAGGRPHLSDGIVPWICWVAASLMTVQAIVLMSYVTGSAYAIRSSGGRLVKRASIAVALGWAAGMYLFLFDRHLHLRFHLMFLADELQPLYRFLLRE